FADLSHFSRQGDILIGNDSRGIPARLFGRKASGGKVELLLLKQRDDLTWEAFVGGKRLRAGVVVDIEAGEADSRGAEAQGGMGASSYPSKIPPQTSNPKSKIQNPKSKIQLVVREDLGESRRLVEFSQPINPWLDEVGHVPLPPYIHE